MTNQQIEYAKYLETRRTNKAREKETHRANLAQEALSTRQLTEVERHNLASEGLQRSSIGAQYAQIQLGYSQLAEQSRANQAREAETTRANLVNESIRLAQNEEQVRHNKETEFNQQLSTGSGFIGGLIKSGIAIALA